jgi:Glu-tRNA(Gln) amidotransferase subunit E-like FAD-binding protein
MAEVMPQVSGRADGSVVSQLVKEKLAWGTTRPVKEKLA